MNTFPLPLLWLEIQYLLRKIHKIWFQFCDLQSAVHGPRARIERSSKAADCAKQFHGYVCQACGFDFEANWGAREREFIEAHHLIPRSTLPEGEPVPMDPAKDFALLCSNCHRMVTE
jgi:predicted HNH restriction endonuclease